MSKLEELLFISGGAFLGIGIGVAYLMRASSGASLVLRLCTAAFGPSLAVLFLITGFWWPDNHRFTASGTGAFLWLQAIPGLLLLLSLFKYPGPRRLHMYLVPLGLLAWVWTFALGWLTVNGK